MDYCNSRASLRPFNLKLGTSQIAQNKYYFDYFKLVKPSINIGYVFMLYTS